MHNTNNQEKVKVKKNILYVINVQFDDRFLEKPWKKTSTTVAEWLSDIKKVSCNLSTFSSFDKSIKEYFELHILKFQWFEEKTQK